MRLLSYRTNMADEDLILDRYLKSHIKVCNLCGGCGMDNLLTIYAGFNFNCRLCGGGGFQCCSCRRGEDGCDCGKLAK